VITNYQFNSLSINPAWAEKNRPAVVKFIKAHIQSLRWIFENPVETVDFLNKEFGMPVVYARRGIDYYTKNKVYPINGDITLSGLKVNIEVQAQDGIIKGALPPPEKYVDMSYLRQAQKELGIQ
jgi:hypothetical protein